MKTQEIKVITECRDLMVEFASVILTYKELPQFNNTVYELLLASYKDFQAHVGFSLVFSLLTESVELDFYRNYLHEFKQDYNIE